MKKLKKIFVIFIAALIAVTVFVFAACGTTPTPNGPGTEIGGGDNNGDNQGGGNGNGDNQGGNQGGNEGDNQGGNQGGGDEGDKPRVLTREQIYTAYKNVGRAMSATEKPQVAEAKNAGRNAAKQRAGEDEGYELFVFNRMGEVLASATPMEYSDIYYDINEQEFLMYYRVAEYCSAQEEFEIGKWHMSDTSEVYCYEMYVDLWYDDDYIYFCYAIKIRSQADGDEDEYIFSYSTLDYDYETDDFCCRVFVGSAPDLSVQSWSNATPYKFYEFACEDGKFCGYLNGFIYDRQGKCYNYYGYGANGYDEYFEGERYGEAAEKGLTEFFADMRPDAEPYAAVAQGLKDAVKDEFALNYFLNNEGDDYFLEYQQRSVELLTALNSIGDGAFKTYLDESRDKWEPVLTEIKDAELSDWVYVNPHAVYDGMYELLSEPTVFVKYYDEFTSQWAKENEMPIIAFFTNMGSWDGFYTDEALTKPLTIADFSSFVFGETVIYQKV